MGFSVFDMFLINYLITQLIIFIHNDTPTFIHKSLFYFSHMVCGYVLLRINLVYKD